MGLKRWAPFQPYRDLTSSGGWLEVRNPFFSADTPDFLVLPALERRANEQNLLSFLSSDTFLFHVSSPLAPPHTH